MTPKAQRAYSGLIAGLFTVLLAFSAGSCKKNLPNSASPAGSAQDIPDSGKIAAGMDASRSQTQSAVTSIEAGPTCNAANGPGTQWANPGSCDCPAKYIYNPVSGLCDGYEPVPAGSKPAKNLAVSAFIPPGSCANDLNEWNNPSGCECPPSSWYNPVSARCDTK